MEQNTKPKSRKPGVAPPQSADPQPHSDPEDEGRRQKIARLKQSLEDGTYRISSDDVARKLIDHMLRPKS